MKSGFVSIVGRPNVGKSTLLNKILDEKVTIVSDKPQTTRTAVRGVLTRPDAQIVFVDTPGIHRPRTLLGERLNQSAQTSNSDVDVTLHVIEATGRVGPGDRFVAERLDPTTTIVVVNKCDAARPEQIADRLQQAAEFEAADYVPVSSVTGDGIDVLIDEIVARLPEGPQHYPDGQVSDVADPVWVAELVREQLLAVTKDELPHSIATRVTEWEWPRIRCEILVERESQKGIVIGKKGQVLKEVGTRVRQQLAKGAYIELQVKVDKDWQRKAGALDRLGY